jgi:hypothetical protein
MSCFSESITAGPASGPCSITAFAVLLLFSIAELPAQDFTYTNTNGTITITGYTGPGGNVTIPSIIDGLPVTSIGSYAFQWFTNLTGVSIPDSVTNIEDGDLWKGGGAGTFWFCAGLTNVAIGKGVMHIGMGAFERCSGLTRAAIPDSVTSIGDFAFHFCTSLSTVTIGKGVTKVGNSLGYVFAQCSNLVAVYFQGDEPFFSYFPEFGSLTSFVDDNDATLYYLPGARGWATPTVEGRPAVLWNPTVLTNDGSFGVKQNRFGFNITGTAGIPIVIEATTNLAAQSWVPLQSGTLTNGLIISATRSGRIIPAGCIAFGRLEAGRGQRVELCA